MAMLHKDEILALVKASSKPLGSKYIATQLKISQAQASRRLSTLATQGHLTRHFAAGNSYTYTEGTGKRLKSKRSKNSNNTKEDTESPVLTTGQVQSLLRAWSHETWRPKIFDSANKLPKTIASLYKLAVRISYGDTVDKLILQEIMIDLQVFRRDLLQTLFTVDGVLSTPQLTNPKDLAVFLLQGMTPDEFDAAADDVVENNS